MVRSPIIALAVFAAGCQDEHCGGEPPSSYEVEGGSVVAEISESVDGEGNLLEPCPNYCSFKPADWVVGCRFVEVVTLEEYGLDEKTIDRLYYEWGLDESGGGGGQGGMSGSLDGPGVVMAVCSMDEPGEDVADCD